MNKCFMCKKSRRMLWSWSFPDYLGLHYKNCEWKKLCSDCYEKVEVLLSSYWCKEFDNFIVSSIIYRNQNHSVTKQKESKNED